MVVKTKICTIQLVEYLFVLSTITILYTYRLFDFPTELKDLASRARWLEAIQRIDGGDKEWTQPGSQEKVCSKHFILGEPTDDSPDPEIFPELLPNADHKQRLELEDSVKRAIILVIHAMDNAAETSKITNRNKNKKAAQIAIDVTVSKRKNSQELWLEQQDVSQSCVAINEMQDPFDDEVQLYAFIHSIIGKKQEDLCIPLDPLIRDDVIAELGILRDEILEMTSASATFDAFMKEENFLEYNEDEIDTRPPQAKRQRISKKQKLTSVLRAESEFPDEDSEHLPLEVVATKMVSLSNKQALALVHTNPNESKPTVYTFGNVITTLLDTIYSLKNKNARLRKEIGKLEHSVESREITVNLLQ